MTRPYPTGDTSPEMNSQEASAKGVDSSVFFIRGYMKSGTNWISQLLNLHPQICCTGEFHWERMKAGLDENLAKVNRYAKNGLGDAVIAEFEAFVRRCLIRAVDQPSRWIGDRTPFSIEPFIIRDAPHISVIRDGRDVLVSRVFHLYNRPDVTQVFQTDPTLAGRLESFQANANFFREHPYELLADEQMVKQSLVNWRNTVIRDHQTVARHPDKRLLLVRYESCHQDAEGERRRMYELLDLDPTAAEPLNDEVKPGFATERPDQFYRKGQVGDWKNYFSDDVSNWFKEIAGETLVTLGYEQNLDW